MRIVAVPILHAVTTALPDWYKLGNVLKSSSTGDVLDMLSKSPDLQTTNPGMWSAITDKIKPQLQGLVTANAASGSTNALTNSTDNTNLSNTSGQNNQPLTGLQQGMQGAVQGQGVMGTPGPSTEIDKGLLKAFPNADPKILQGIYDNKDILNKYGINNPARVKQFLAQIGEETAGFTTLQEIGKTSPYSGGGYIQLTGKDNYQDIGNKIGTDLVSNPQLLRTDPRTALAASAAYWNSNNLNQLADQGNISGITRLINGPAMRGLNTRVSNYNNLQGQDLSGLIQQPSAPPATQGTSS